MFTGEGVFAVEVMKPQVLRRLWLQDADYTQGRRRVFPDAAEAVLRIERGSKLRSAFEGSSVGWRAGAG